MNGGIGGTHHDRQQQLTGKRQPPNKKQKTETKKGKKNQLTGWVLVATQPLKHANPVGKTLPIAVPSSCKWEMGKGKWQMTNGKWQVANGKWQMANGNWEMGNGKRQMANGKWQVANGKWQMAEWQNIAKPWTSGNGKCQALLVLV